MPYISILTAPGQDRLQIVASRETPRFSQPIAVDGTFGGRPQMVVFQREVPDPDAVLQKVRTALATSQVQEDPSLFQLSAPDAIRTLEECVAELWPPNRLFCQACQHHFVAPIAEARRMYLACPHCHNPMLNPRWDSA